MKFMKTKITLLICSFLIINNCYSQQLKNVLDGYTISKIPTQKSIVGAKWVTDLGATMEGLPETDLTIAQSLNQISIDKENQGYLGLALLSSLGLTGYASNDLNVIFNKLEVYTIKNLYQLPLSKGEKIVFSSIKVASFDLEFNKQIAASVLAKLPQNNISVDAEVDYGSKKRITINGSNLFIAHKIIKIDNIKSKTVSKKLKNSFSVKKIMDYDVNFNVDKLTSYASNKTVEEIGLEKYNNLKALDLYIQKYSLKENINVNIMSTSRGNLSSGIFNENLKICYCELIGQDKKLYPINVINTGDKITFDYLYIDNFWIQYKLMNGVYSPTSEKAIGMVTSSDNSKISIISKTYFISKVVD